MTAVIAPDSRRLLARVAAVPWVCRRELAVLASAPRWKGNAVIMAETVGHGAKTTASSRGAQALAPALAAPVLVLVLVARALAVQVDEVRDLVLPPSAVRAWAGPALVPRVSAVVLARSRHLPANSTADRWVRRRGLAVAADVPRWKRSAAVNMVTIPHGATANGMKLDVLALAPALVRVLASPALAAQAGEARDLVRPVSDVDLVRHRVPAVIGRRASAVRAVTMTMMIEASADRIGTTTRFSR